MDDIVLILVTVVEENAWPKACVKGRGIVRKTQKQTLLDSKTQKTVLKSITQLSKFASKSSISDVPISSTYQMKWQIKCDGNFHSMLRRI